MATDGVISADDRRALRAIRATASADESLGATFAGYEWLADGLTQDEAEALETVGEIVTPGFTTQTAPASAQREWVSLMSLRRAWTPYKSSPDYPWLQDAVAAPESDALNRLVETISHLDPPDPNFLVELLRVGWLQDEVEDVEIEAIDAWGEFIRATETIGSPAAQTVWAYDWARDDVTPTEIAFLHRLTELTRAAGDFHAKSLDIVASYDWIADGIDGTEAAFLSRLTPLFEYAGTEDAAALQTVLGYAWIADGLIVSRVSPDEANRVPL